MSSADNLVTMIPREYTVGPVRIAPSTVLAPMAGVTDTVFRRLIRSQGGCGLIMTEFTSSHGIVANAKSTGVDPRGKTYYWLSGEVVQDLDQPEHLHLPPEIETDVQAIKRNFITIVPLQFNMTSTTGVFGLKDCGVEDLKSFKS